MQRSWVIDLASDPARFQESPKLITALSSNHVLVKNMEGVWGGLQYSDRKAGAIGPRRRASGSVCGDTLCDQSCFLQQHSVSLCVASPPLIPAINVLELHPQN